MSETLKLQAGREPTAAEMSIFADRWTTAEWRRLCTDRQFISLVSTNLNRAAVLAEQILAGKKPKPATAVTAEQLRDNPDAWKKS